MKEIRVTVPQLGLIAGTRGMLGAGAGLLLADRLSREQRRAVGLTLLLVGALTTIPLVAQLVERAGGMSRTQRENVKRHGRERRTASAAK
jgi:hypothetical protein